MSKAESYSWAAFILFLGFVLPSMLHYRIELRGWRQGLMEALQSATEKWWMEFDSLESITLVCVIPFVVLAAGGVLSACLFTRRVAVGYILAGLSVVLAIWVPLGIHSLKMTYSDYAPPFSDLLFWGLSFLSTFMVGMLFFAFRAFLWVIDSNRPLKRSS